MWIYIHIALKMSPAKMSMRTITNHDFQLWGFFLVTCWHALVSSGIRREKEAVIWLKNIFNSEYQFSYSYRWERTRRPLSWTRSLPNKPDTDTTKIPDDDTQNNGNSMLVCGIKISSNHFYKHFLYKLHVRKLNKGFCSAVGIAEEFR